MLDALEAGYRFLDCGQFYGNEAAVGEAIKRSGVRRSELYIASKVWTDNIYQGAEAVQSQIRKSMRDLQVDYLDMYLVHWPVPTKHVEAYCALENLQNQGIVRYSFHLLSLYLVLALEHCIIIMHILSIAYGDRSIGVSNYTIEDYEELMQYATVTPAINQIEVNPFLYRRHTIDYFQSKGVAIEAYSPLRQGKEFTNPIIQDVAAKYSRAPAQILGRWCVQQGIIYLPKSENKDRMV